MNYPVWSLPPAVNGGFLIALIAVTHVFVALFAVGGGLFLVLTERKGHRERAPEIIAFTKRHTWFFFLLTMVFGSVSGVGIWFVVSLVNPAATSILIHSFVFGWAMEWVFFTCEIIALFLYYYTFDTLPYAAHQKIGWMYFIFAWLSLFIINGIVSCMLTPGEWAETRNFFDGFFNPSMWSSLAFRTFFAFSIAGLFGLVTATRWKTPRYRLKLTRYCALWLILPMAGLFASGFWYYHVITPFSREMIRGGSPEIPPFFRAFLLLSPLLFAGGILLTFRVSHRVKQYLAVILLAGGLLHFGAFEWVRESARRPYVLFNVLYSNNVPANRLHHVKRSGYLSQTRWIQERNIHATNELAVGKALFRHLCLPCHTVGGVINDILPRTEEFSELKMEAFLDGMGKFGEYMPEFPGNNAEKRAVARYIIRELHGVQPIDRPLRKILEKHPEVPPFDPDSDEYVLLGWSDDSLRVIQDDYRYIVMAFPGTTIRAQLIRRGKSPEIVTAGVRLRYSAPKAFLHPSEHLNFWEFGRLVPGGLQHDRGITGRLPEGDMTLVSGTTRFEADQVPLVPVSEDGGIDTCPVLTLIAEDVKTGRILAETRITARISTELGCGRCHGSGSEAGTHFGGAVALDILETHDQLEKTTLLQQARSGSPVFCQKCHGDASIRQDGGRAEMNLSAAIHGFHANFLTGREAETCRLCHPGSAAKNPVLRDIHFSAGLDCTACHGVMEDHALTLLKMEYRYGKRSPYRSMAHLMPRAVERVKDVVWRDAWLNEPDCLGCHVDFSSPEDDDAFNKWASNPRELYRNKTDDMGVYCAACHGGAHAVYPAEVPAGETLDVLQPLQYQAAPGAIGSGGRCKVCHTTAMEDEAHHPNMLPVNAHE